MREAVDRGETATAGAEVTAAAADSGANPGGGLDAWPAGFRHLPGYFDQRGQEALLGALRAVIEVAPLFVPRMPRTGKAFSVRMTNCGSLGWVSDRGGGYRYQATHPETGRPWPAMPQALIDLWDEVAGFLPRPEACLINYYAAGARMGSHRDADEEDFAAPVLSVSLGDDAVFHVGGAKRSDAKRRLALRSGDVVVLGGDARLERFRLSWNRGIPKSGHS